MKKFVLIATLFLSCLTDAQNFSDDAERIIAVKQKPLLLIQVPSHGGLADLLDSGVTKLGGGGHLKYTLELLRSVKTQNQGIMLMCSDKRARLMLSEAAKRVADGELVGVSMILVGGDLCDKKLLENIAHSGADYAVI